MEYLRKEMLAPYTTVKIGGPAEYFIHCTNKHQFEAVLRDAANKQFSNITILGNGSNVLISDQGLPGLVIKNSSSGLEIKNNQVVVDSGTQLSYLIEKTIENGLVGLETFAYIPSTIGGAIAGNIHGTTNLISDYLESYDIFDLDSKKTITLKSISELNNYSRPIILKVVLNLKQGDFKKAKDTVKKIIDEKQKSQPTNSLGCVFKNPENLAPAGYIIDQQLKLKGYTIGDIEISEKHANFIINKGKGTAKDYYKIIKLIQKKAKEQGINLELEIKLLGQI